MSKRGFPDVSRGEYSLLGCVGLVVHKKEVEVSGIVDEERLVARGHHMAGFLVAAVSDLWSEERVVSMGEIPIPKLLPSKSILSFEIHSRMTISYQNHTHLWHRRLALEPSPHSVVDSLGFSPAWVHAHEPVGLMAVEARSVLLDDRNMFL